MLRKIDQVLDSITMYRLVLYLLIFFLAIAVFFGLLNQIPFAPIEIISSSLFLIVICWTSNKAISRVLNAPINVESSYITGLILSLIVSPAQNFPGFVFLAEVGVLAMASKYILTINKKNIFNPTAVAVVIATFVFSHSASWWIGTFSMTPFVLIGGLLVVRKLQFEKLVGSFLLTSVGVFAILTLVNGGDIIPSLNQLLLNSSILFFAFIMLTEPSTLPPTKNLRASYGAIIGILSVPQLSFGNFYIAPEMALVIGNIFSFLVGSKQKLILKLNEKRTIAQSMMEFVFTPKKKFSYVPGQYMEWTFPHKNTDSRGNRRYFTLASSPTEENIRLGVRFYENGSSFKNHLKDFPEKGVITAGSLGGDFTLPKDKNRKIVFVAGGIGVTPYRSMIKFLLDRREKRDIVLLYSNTTEGEIAYKDIFDRANSELGIKVIYVLTGDKIPSSWKGKTGRINKDLIISEIPDYKKRLFYISGSQPLVNGVKQSLKELRVSRSQIKTDFFPGYA